MKYLAAALITITCLVGSILADAGIIAVTERRGWDLTAAFCLAGFGLLVAFGGDT